jgi:hypothetical protein
MGTMKVTPEAQIVPLVQPSINPPYVICPVDWTGASPLPARQAGFRAVRLRPQRHEAGGVGPRSGTQNDFRNVLIEPHTAGAGIMRVVVRLSTSAGIRDKATGELIDPSGTLQGLHGYIPVADGTKTGSDSARFLKVLLKRCWLAGFGWGVLASNGSFLVRASSMQRWVAGAAGLRGQTGTR